MPGAGAAHAYSMGQCSYFRRKVAGAISWAPERYQRLIAGGGGCSAGSAEIPVRRSMVEFSTSFAPAQHTKAVRWTRMIGRAHPARCRRDSGANSVPETPLPVPEPEMLRDLSALSNVR